jgi:hypothetical protein
VTIFAFLFLSYGEALKVEECLTLPELWEEAEGYFNPSRPISDVDQARELISNIISKVADLTGVTPKGWNLDFVTKLHDTWISKSTGTGYSLPQGELGDQRKIIAETQRIIISSVSEFKIPLLQEKSFISKILRFPTPQYEPLPPGTWVGIVLPLEFSLMNKIYDLVQNQISALQLSRSNIDWVNCILKNLNDPMSKSALRKLWPTYDITKEAYSSISAGIRPPMPQKVISEKNEHPKAPTNSQGSWDDFVILGMSSSFDAHDRPKEASEHALQATVKRLIKAEAVEAIEPPKRDMPKVAAQTYGSSKEAPLKEDRIRPREIPEDLKELIHFLENPPHLKVITHTPKAPPMTVQEVGNHLEGFKKFQDELLEFSERDAEEQPKAVPSHMEQLYQILETIYQDFLRVAEQHKGRTISQAQRKAQEFGDQLQGIKKTYRNRVSFSLPSNTGGNVFFTFMYADSLDTLYLQYPYMAKIYPERIDAFGQEMVQKPASERKGDLDDYAYEIRMVHRHDRLKGLLLTSFGNLGPYITDWLDRVFSSSERVYFMHLETGAYFFRFHFKESPGVLSFLFTPEKMVLDKFSEDERVSLVPNYYKWYLNLRDRLIQERRVAAHSITNLPVKVMRFRSAADETSKYLSIYYGHTFTDLCDQDPFLAIMGRDPRTLELAAVIREFEKMEVGFKSFDIFSLKKLWAVDKIKAQGWFAYGRKLFCTPVFSDRWKQIPSCFATLEKSMEDFTRSIELVDPTQRAFHILPEWHQVKESYDELTRLSAVFEENESQGVRDWKKVMQELSFIDKFEQWISTSAALDMWSKTIASFDVFGETSRIYKKWLQEMIGGANSVRISTADVKRHGPGSYVLMLSFRNSDAMMALVYKSSLKQTS